MYFKKVDCEVGGLVNDNLKKLESIFPSVIKDGEVDFEELKELLGDFKEADKEKYEMNWVGKKEAKKIALSPIYGKTLKYIEGNGKNEDITENLYIEGDNLEVLKLLQNSYYGKVKMIYIDPPYNTGNDFVYNDKFKDDKSSIEILEGDRNIYGNRLIKNQNSTSNFHSSWMNMIYSRLVVSKSILSEDGVIYISIDDNEVANLKKICDEIFGEENFVANFTRKTSYGAKTSKPRIDKHHEFCLCYAKNIEILKKNDVLKGDIKEYGEYSNPDNDPKGEWKKDSVLIKIDNGRYGHARYPITNPYLNITHYPPVYYDENDRKQWHYIESTFKELEKIGQVVYYKSKEEMGINKYSFYIKKYKPKEIDYNNISTVEFCSNEYVNAKGTSTVKDLLGNDSFSNSYPKPVEFIQKLVDYSMKNEKNGIILDFFSGSATTAQSVLELNNKDGGCRKFIMVQLPEKVDENKEQSGKSKYKNICEIGKERIRRAGDKILQENKDKEGIENLDIGFKVFRVEDSNIRWQNQLEDYGQIRYDLDGKNIDDIDFVLGTKDIDVVYEILLRHYGIPLTAKIEKLDFIGNRTYAIQGSIIVCLETQITKDIVDKISELEPVKVIFRDSAFGDDISLKQNSVHRLNVLIEKNNKNTTHVVEFI